MIHQIIFVLADCENIGGHVTTGTVVEIYIVVPPTLEWNGLPIHTAAVSRRV
tara:strand:+ start:30983 stop:31138 length:156 start_codon:yes stop_codon:yes gene_type:complete